MSMFIKQSISKAREGPLSSTTKIPSQTLHYNKTNKYMYYKPQLDKASRLDYIFLDRSTYKHTCIHLKIHLNYFE